MNQEAISYFKPIFLDLCRAYPEEVKEALGIKSLSTKQCLTTRELCEAIGVNYNTWNAKAYGQLPEIIKLRAKDSVGKNYVYKIEDIEKIRKIIHGF